MVEEGFLRPDTRKLLVVDGDPATLLEKMEIFRSQNAENKPLDGSLYVDKH